VPVAGDCWLMLMDGGCSTDTFVALIAREPMFANVRESVVGDSLPRNALIAGEHRPETRNSNGVFRVMEYREALRTRRVLFRLKNRPRPSEASLRAKSEASEC
jgi:hypothetical protein